MGNTTSNATSFDGLCYTPLAFPLPLNESTCAPGFYCPNISNADPFTYPMVCPPSVDCSLNRLASKYCEPQGPFEPVTCPPGNFCPNYTTLEVCPEGSYCLRASWEPRPCPVMSYCPAGTEMRRFYGGVVIAILVDIVMAGFYLWYRYVGEPAVWKARREARRTGKPLGEVSIYSVLLAQVLGLFGLGSGHGSQTGAGAADDEGDAMEMTLLDTPTVPHSKGLDVKSAVLGSLAAAADGLGVSVPWLAGVGGSASSGGQGKETLGFYGRLEDDGEAKPTDTSTASLASEPSFYIASSAVEGLPAKKCLEDAFSRCNAGLRMGLSFEGLSFTLPAPDGRTILSGVTGRIVPGRVTAIMGPSGAGKTTFLNVLMGKYNRTAGVLRINGQTDEMHRFKRIIGYVPQDDVMIRELTVRENILFSARVRLPRHGWDDVAIQRHVDAIIQVLGLSGCADTLASRVSGGQRKRTNIGMELAAAPATIFLDEPTSGLDSTAALEVCSTLKAIADLGLTVVAVIHQPRVEIFTSFDDLLLLCPGGLTVYAGPQAAVVPYFRHLGFEFGVGSNPADDLLDFVAGKGRVGSCDEFLDRIELSEDGEKDVFGLRGDRGQHASPISTPKKLGLGLGSHGGPGSPRKAQRSVATLLADTWAKHGAALMRGLRSYASGTGLRAIDSSTLLSGLATPVATASAAGTMALGSEATDVTESSQPIDAATGISLSPTSAAAHGIADDPSADGAHSNIAAFNPNQLTSDRGAPFLTQVLLCHHRAVVQQYRTVSSYALEMGVGMLAGAIMGSAAMQLPELYVGVLKPPYTLLSPSPLETLLPSIGMYVALAVGLAGSPAGVKTFGEEKDVFYREASSGHNKLAYYTAKSLSQLYRFTLGALHFTAVFHVLASPATDFTTMFGLVWCQYFAVYGLAALMSMIVARENSALLGVIVALIAGCLCGFGPSLVQGRKWGIGWVQDMSHARWANEAFFHSETLPYRTVYMVEEVSAPLFGYTLDRFAFDVFMMILIGLVHRALAYGLLIGLSRDKQR